MSIGRRSSSASWSIRWPLVFALAGALLLLVAVSAGRETYRTWKVEEEIGQLQAQVDALEGKKLNVLDTIQELGSSDTLDKEARLRLGMKKPGERVIVVKGLESGELESWNDSLPDEHLMVAPSNVNAKVISNPQKWFHYFFSSDTP